MNKVCKRKEKLALVKEGFSERDFFENQWLNSKEAAEFFRTSTQQIRNWVYQGKLNAYKLFGERKLYFKLSDLESCLQPVGGSYED